MTDMESNKAPSNNRGLIIFGIVSAVIAVTVLAIVGALFLGAPEIEEPDVSKEPTTTEFLSSSIIPALLSLDYKHSKGEITAEIVFTLEDFEEDLYVEYRVEDDLKKIADSGTVKNGETITSLVNLKSGSNKFGVKVRVSDSTAYTEWKTLDYVTIDASEIADDTEARRVPSEAYFNTPWGTGKETNQEALEEALGAAYNATPVTMQDVCMPINKDTVSSKEIFPPVPSTMTGYKLKFHTMDYMDGNFEVAYYWCE